MMDPAILVRVFLLVLVLVIAHSVETLLGFGASIIAIALGIYIFPLTTILPVLAILFLLQNIWMVSRWFKYVQWRVLLVWILPASIIGMGIGIYYRTLVGSYSQLLIILGLFIMAVSVMEIVLIYRTRAAGGILPWYLSWPILLVGGVFHGLYAQGQPMAIYYLSREFKEPAEFRATVSMLYLILNVMLITSLYTIGQIDLDTVATAGIVLPGLILGIFLGSRMKFRTLPFKVLVYVLLFIAGLLLFIERLITP
jgi:uncharacterized membrane protein YfcA